MSKLGNYSMKESGKPVRGLSPLLPLFKHFQHCFCFCNSSELPNITDTVSYPPKSISLSRITIYGHVLRVSVPPYSQTIRVISFLLSGGFRHGYMIQTWPVKSEGKSAGGNFGQVLLTFRKEHKTWNISPFMLPSSLLFCEDVMAGAAVAILWSWGTNVKIKPNILKIGKQ